MTHRWRARGFGRTTTTIVAVASLVLAVVAVPAAAQSAGGTFVDDDGNTHEGYIEAIAAEGVTKGCNPPANDRYCPADTVTRGQMAAFLRRALSLPPSSTNAFVDDEGSTFEGDIDAVAAAGITKGCNPPVNDRYCPADTVTRGQMAAFLVRAFGYADDGGGDLFVDDDGSTFEKDIDRLGTAGVTKGCNPPANDRYCPDDPVRRDQMASFLGRALGLTPLDVPPAVTSGPDYPAAVSGALVPWSEVGPGWHLALYDGTPPATMPDVAARIVLYLVDPAGTRYEVASWRFDEGPYAISDWRPDGAAALLAYPMWGPVEQRQARLVDLRSGDEAVVASVPEGHRLWVEFTRPSGANLVVLDNDGSNARLERRTTGGTLLAALADQPGDLPDMRWLYHYDGTEVIVAEGNLLLRVANNGTLRGELWRPAGQRCEPVRWWSAGTVLAACTDLTQFHNRLWLIPLDGTEGEALTAPPPGPVDVVDFGLVDAWRTATVTLGQWVGDCGAATVREIEPDGSTVSLLGTSVPQEMVDVVDGTIAGRVWRGCDPEDVSLIATDLDGDLERMLVPVTGEARGVVSVDGLAEVYP